MEVSIIRFRKVISVILLNIRMYAQMFKFSPISIGIMCVVSLLIGALPLFIAWLLGSLTSVFSNNQSFMWLIMALFLLWAFNSILGTIRGFLSKHIINMVSPKLMKKFNDKISTCDFRWKESEYGNTVMRGAYESVSPGIIIDIVNLVTQFMSSITSIVSCVCLLYLYNPVVPFVDLVIFLCVSSILAGCIKKQNEYYDENSFEDRLLANYENIPASKEANAELRAYNSIDFIRNIWNENYNILKKKRYQFKLKNEITIKSCYFILEVMPFVSIFILMYSGNFTSGNVITVITACSMLSASINNISNNWEFLTRNSQHFNYYYRLFNNSIPKCRDEGQKGKSVSISLNNVSFKYNDCDNFAVKSVNAFINTGEKVAIVGMNASGKTTLAKLILNIYKPTEGSIEVKNSLNNEGSFKANVVFQDFVKYNLPLRCNVAFGDISNFDNNNILEKALEKVGMESLLNSMQLEDHIGTFFGGRELSGGEWQRIALSRAFLSSEATMVLFDEPNASLDPIAESFIIKRMIEFAKDKTCIFISHRLSCIKYVDRVMVMKDGEMVEFDKPEKLMEKKGEYYRLYSAQAEMYN